MDPLTLIVIGLIVLVVIFAVTMYNRLVKLRNRVDASWSQIDVQLKRRSDLVPNLVETVKGYAAHERETLDAVITARQQTAQANTVEERAQAENMLTGALRQLFAVSEAYPDLKANQNFQQLQAELSDIENKLAAARRFFNNAVQEFNTGIQNFPAVLFAAALGFHAHPFFDLGENRAAAEQAPQVKF